MWIKVTLIVLGLLGVALLSIVLINRVLLDRANAKLVAELLAERQPPSSRVFQKDDVVGLPAPVQRYLLKVIPEGRPYVETVRLHQVGEFRLGDATAPWKSLAADQHFTVSPPGFVWDARIEMAPLVQARVIDMYRDGRGLLRAKVFSTLTVAEAQGQDELNVGELMRYLAEAVWFPTAFLPGQGIEWAAIDDRSARATIGHQGIQASVLFYFDDRDQVERIHADRWYQTEDGSFELTPWTGYWSDYQIRDGLLIPIEGRVEWNRPEGDVTYWHARLHEIEYDVSAPGRSMKRNDAGSMIE